MKRFSLIASVFMVMIGIWFLPLQQANAKEDSRNRNQSKSNFKPQVLRTIKHDTSTRPLREVKSKPGQLKPRIPHPPKRMQKTKLGISSGVDTALDQGQVITTAPDPFISFEGASNDENVEVAGGGVVPPDTNGDVGPNHYVQYINLIYKVYNKDGTLAGGPFPGNAFWDGFGGPCEETNHGDPVVLYDQLADRWVVGQFALPFYPNGPFYQCVAVSTSPDPLGTYHRYQFDSPTKLNDYPKFGVWRDGYYMTVNQFEDNVWAGAGVYAFERDEMLSGNIAQVVYFDLANVTLNFGGLLPSDLDGPAPPAGTPNIFAEMDDEVVFGTDRLNIWEFHVDWADISNSTFGIDGNPNLHLDTAPFVWGGVCTFQRDCIPQPSPGEGLDAITDRLMYRLQYRYFGSYSTLVTNHTVNAGDNRAGIRWYEVRDSGSGWAIRQQGTYAPDDGIHRWMGSAAMDSAGNIAIAFSASSSSLFPSIHYAARLASDPLGEMSQGERVLHTGTGAQVDSSNRWGDYSGLVVDPSAGKYGSNDCDFWITNEYYAETAAFDFKTRIGAFSFAPGACSGGGSGTFQGTVTNSANAPIEGAKVTFEPGGFSTTTNLNGQYLFTLPPGVYDVSASAYGYFSKTVTGQSLSPGGTTIVNFALDPSPQVTVSGTITDGSAHGWPLYARIDIKGYPDGPIFTDPIDGTYSVELVQGNEFTFYVNAISSGYQKEVRKVIPAHGGSIEDFALVVNLATCDAPGYQFTGILEDFTNQTLPDDWTVLKNGPDPNVEWLFHYPFNRNTTGGTGGFAIVDSDSFGFDDGSEDTELLTPVFDFSGSTNAFIQFDTDFRWYFDGLDEKGDVDVSTDGGSTWTNVLRYEDRSFRGPRRHESIDISSIADNQSQVKIRFHYYDADFEYWWAIDNVSIGSCIPVNGGNVFGNVRDENTGDGLNGATVTSDSKPSETTTTFATPDDPNLDDGFYILFSSLTGVQSFTASNTEYQSDTQQVNVVEDDAVQQDFNLDDPCNFCENFDDTSPPTNWTTKGTWAQANGTWSTSGKQHSAIATPAFAGCGSNCAITASVSTSGGRAKLWVYGWWVDKDNTIEVVFKEDEDKVVISQIAGGVVVKKENVALTINPNTFYTITLTYNGTNIVVNVNGTDQMTFSPIGALPVGTLGVAGKDGTTKIDFVSADEP